MNMKPPFTKPALFFASLIAFLAAGGTGITQQAWAACDDEASAGVDWQDCRKRNLIMTDFDFTGANFSRADLSSSDLRGTTLDDAKFFKSNLVRASLKGSSAKNADFSGVTASRTDFGDLNLTGANFEKSEIIRSSFAGSTLHGVDMSKSDLFRADFRNAKLSGVDLGFSSLARADFRGVTLENENSMAGAYFYRTRLEGVDLSNVQGIAQWQIDMACGDAETVLPEGLNRPEDWKCADGDDE